jgi:hypothetical protein
LATELFRDVSEVGEGDEQVTDVAMPADSKSVQCKVSHDPARHAHADPDAESHLDGDPSCASRPRRQEHQQLVVSRLRPARTRTQHQPRARSRGQSDACGPESEPCRRPAPVDGLAGHIHHDPLGACVSELERSRGRRDERNMGRGDGQRDGASDGEGKCQAQRATTVKVTVAA